jgi:DNA polymerase-3 subunit beta
MKFTIPQSELLKAIKIVYPAIKQNQAIPICETIKFELTADEMALTATNIQVELSTIIKNDFKDVGSFCLPAVKLYNLVSNLADQPLEISTTDKIAIIKTGNGKYELPISDATDFPIFKIEPDKSIIIDAELFQSAIKKTVFACSDDDLRPNMTGVFIEINKNEILFTSTDAHRVNHAERAIESDLETSIIIPASSLSLLPQATGDLEISFSKNNISIQSGDISFKSTLIDDKFPDYRSVIPVNDKELFINKNELISAVKRISAFANFATNLLKLEIGETIKISGQNVEYSEYAEEILRGELRGEPIIIGLSSQYLAESANAIETDEFFMLFSEPNRGVLIKESLTDNNYIMVMPQIISA